VTVGVMSSAVNESSNGESIYILAVRLGKAIEERNRVLFRGETNGLPGKVLEGARKAGGTTVGCSAARSFEEHK